MKLKAHNKKEFDIDLMIKLYYEDGFDYNKLSEYFSVSKSTICDRFKRFNLIARNNTDLKTGFKHSEETKLKISKASKGFKHSEETKQKLSEFNKGKNNSMYGKIPVNYKGGYVRKDGYKELYVNGKQVLEHRYVWMEHNSYIKNNCVVHHIDRNKLNNNISNLMMMTNVQHGLLHNLNVRGIIK